MAAKISLTRYLVEQQRADGLIPSQLRLLLEVVARACKSISQAVNKGALGGVLGRWSLRGDPATLAALWPWLWLGQWLHVGKNATMGMGAYALEGVPT